MNVFSIEHDQVVRALVGQGVTDYRIALDKFYPLIDRLGIQRKIQDPKFYDRLKRDIINGCVMPPITIAFIDSEGTINEDATPEELSTFLTEGIAKGFILDGIQRLNTLHRASAESPDTLNLDKKLYFSVLVCSSMDSLLYRMITLNNGQKPMTTRHQIEIISSNIYDFEEAPLPIHTEKQNGRKKGNFKQVDFVLAYLAFLSNSTTIDNQKLIGEKLDELIAFKILETDRTKPTIEFSQILELIDNMSTNDQNKIWFKNANNLIGFCSAIRESYESLARINPDEFFASTEQFELALGSFQVSKIKLGQARRNAVNKFISDYENTRKMGYLEIMEVLAKHI